MRKPKKSAKKPILHELKKGLHDPVLTRQLAAGFVLNVAVIMIVPMSMAALKRAYAISDSVALLYSLVQFGSCAVMSFATGKLNALIGPRRSMMLGLLMLVSAGFLWASCPAQLQKPRMFLIFLLLGAAFVIQANAVMHYYLQTIAPVRQVAYSILVALVTSVGAGLAGMTLSGGILMKTIGKSWAPGSIELLNGYRLYFLCAALILIPGMFFLFRLTPLPKEKRICNIAR